MASSLEYCTMSLFNGGLMNTRATDLHNSRLIRVLSDLRVIDAAGPGIAFAEKLGLWLDHHDAIALRAAHTTSIPIMLSGVNKDAGVCITDEFTRKRESLVDAIRKTGVANAGSAKVELHSLEQGVPLDFASAYEPYRRCYLEHQRNMTLSIRALRAQVREVLAKASPGLSKLAALDAALEGILCDRESKLLATVPLLLARRFEQLGNAHEQTQAAMQHPDSPAIWMQAQSWLARFCNELQTVLLAELDLRLQPTVGLIEAFNNKTSHQ